MTYSTRERLHPDLLTDLLQARGMMTEDEQARFLSPDFLRDSHDPFLLPDMQKAVERIGQAVKNEEHVVVWSDYDCDGIPGGVMLTEFLRSIGLTVTHYIPHRHKEGYGLNVEGLAVLAQKKASLLITVDLGISDVEPVTFANSAHIDVIITDHHLAPEILPEAYAIINPKRPGSKYPFDGLCGAGVAWKLVQGILVTNRFNLPEGQEKWLLDLVGLATLSDRVPLVDENRMLSHYGILVMKRTRRVGLAALLSMLRIRPSTLTEDDIAFMITPRINAASRMDEPELAAQLLATHNPEEARTLAHALQFLNEKRKSTVTLITKEVRKRFSEGTDKPIIVLGNPSWRPGVLGLVAGSLVETYGKPVFLWGREGGDVIRGSCRSDGSLNIVELMSATRDLFNGFGGHFSSGGFSISQDRVHELSAKLEEAYLSMRRSPSEKPVVIEGELPLEEIPHAHSAIKRLAPFGENNPKPLFCFPKTHISQVRSFGKGGAHLALLCTAGASRIEGISFFSHSRTFTKTPHLGDTADIIGHIETDWRGSSRIRVIDLV